MLRDALYTQVLFTVHKALCRWQREVCAMYATDFIEITEVGQVRLIPMRKFRNLIKEKQAFKVFRE